MPYNKRKQKCTQSDGDKGNYVLSYTTKKGEKRRACHTSEKNMQGQIAAIEAEADMSEEEVLEEALRSLVREAMVSIGDKSYKIPDDKIESLVNYITSPEGLNVSPHDAKLEFESYLEGIQDTQAKDSLVRIVTTAIPERFQPAVMEMLIELDPNKLVASLFNSEPAGEVPVPEVLRDIADFSTPGSQGTQIGRGELVVPFMFPDAFVDPGANALYDVTIGEEGWHVKEARPQSGIRMGSAKDKLFSATPIYRHLVSKGADPSDFNELGQKSLKSLLPTWASSLEMTPEELYTMMSEQAVDASVGDAAGILWYFRGTFTFTPKEDLQLVSLTQGRVKLSTTGKNKILGESVDKYEKIRHLVREALLTEELTGSDKADIKRMIKKELEGTTNRREIDKAFKKNFDKELKKALGASFFGTPGKINKFVTDEIRKEVEKNMGSDANREVVVRICKDVMVKLYRELSFSYKPLIDRMKV